MSSSRPSRGDCGERVLTTDFVFPDDEPMANDSEADALELLRKCVIVIIESGHADAVGVRTAALGRLLGLYGSDSEISKKMGVAPSTLARAKIRLHRKLLGALSKVPPH